MDFHTRKQGHLLIFSLAVVGIAFILKIFFFLFFPVMIAIQHIHAMILIKFSHHPELIAVYPYNFL